VLEAEPLAKSLRLVLALNAEAESRMKRPESGFETAALRQDRVGGSSSSRRLPGGLRFNLAFVIGNGGREEIWLGVNPEGMAYQGWQIVTFILSEIARPHLRLDEGEGRCARAYPSESERRALVDCRR
jgi:hypothetical protein